MQNATPFWSSPLAFALNAFAIPVASLVTFVLTRIFTRRAEASEILNKDALTRRIEAESRQIDSEIVLKAYERLDQLEGIIHQMSLDKTRYAASIGKLEWQLGLSESREKVLNQQITLAHAELEVLRTPRVT